MAIKYVWSGASGAGTGADWANAYLLVGTAFAAMASGDTAYVAHDHAEVNTGSVTLTSPGTEANPCFVICVDRAGTVPPVSADLRTTATYTTTGTGSALTFTGSVYYYGIIFSCATGAGSASLAVGSTTALWLYFKNCALRRATTAASAFILIGTTTAAIRQKITLDNTTLQFGAVTDVVGIRSCSFTWINTPSAITGATFPTTLFTSTAASLFSTDVVWIEGVDFSSLGSGKTIVGANERASRWVLKDCKLNASVTIAATPNGPGGGVTHVIRSDSAGTNYRHEKISYLGTQTVETTIVRTGGASDGTTPIAQKVITTANAKPIMPFEMLPIAVWNDTSGGARTATIEGIWGGGAVPTNTDIWMDAEYQSDASSGQGAFVSGGRADVLAAASNLAAGTGTWGGSTTKFKLEVTFTPQQKGTVYLYIKCGAASSTFYIDPKVVLT